MSSASAPRVGIGVILVNPAGEILLGRRLSSHAPAWSIPGGHLEEGETFETCAIREVLEETGLHIRSPQLVSVCNDLETYAQSGRHYISLTLLARVNEGDEPELREPDKCAGWIWCDPHQLPAPHFASSRDGISNWLTGRFYQSESDNMPG